MALLGQRPRGSRSNASAGNAFTGNESAGNASPAPPRAPGPAPGRPPSRLPSRLPGLALAAAGVASAAAVHLLLPAVPLLTAAVLLGIAAAHLPGTRTLVHGSCRPGLTLAGKRLMRVGIVLLGLKLSLGDVLGLGWATVAMVCAVVAATLAGTVWLGRRLGLPGDQPLLIATGYAICGASAIGAVSEVRRPGGRTGPAAPREHEQGHQRDEQAHQRDTATAIAVVTLCGTLAIAVLPLLQYPLGLDDGQFGRWVGAGVHDVGQVVATAQTAGEGALGQAVLVKLIRVAMLAPLVAAIVLAARRSRTRGGVPQETGSRPPLVPLFVVGFLAMVLLRTTGLLPSVALDAAATAQELLLAAALFGLGSAVHLPTLARTGWRVAVLGASAWVVIAGVSYAGVLLTT